MPGLEREIRAALGKHRVPNAVIARLWKLIAARTASARRRRVVDESASSLQRRSALLQMALDHIDQGIGVFGPDKRLVAFNRRFVDLLDIPAELAVPGTPVEAFIRFGAERGDYGPGDVEELVAARLEKARSATPLLLERTGPEGTVIEVRANPLPEGGWVASYTDVTEQHRAQRRLAAAKEEAEAASRTKSEFLANISHELRTPLNAIIGFSDVMRSELLGPLGPRYRSYAKDIQESGEHLLGIINDILDLSKIEAGRLTLHEEIVDPAAIARDCTRLVSARAEEAGVLLRLRVLADAPRQVSADELKLKQILLNLLSNAIKFTPRGGHVDVVLQRGRDGNLEIMIEDTGVGMSDEDLAIALQPFGQVESTFTRTRQGTGLGLPLTKGLVELHGGTMRIESALGRGTTVTVSFPLVRVWAAA